VNANDDEREHAPDTNPAPPLSELQARINATRQKREQSRNAVTVAPPKALPAPARKGDKRVARSPLAKPVDIQQNAPEAPEAEQAVLGAMLQWPETCVPEARRLLTRGHFYNPVNAELFTTMLVQFDAGKAEPSRWLIPLTQFLRDSKRLDALGGAHYVTNLATEPIAESSVSFYAQMLHEKFVLRELIALGSKLVRASYSAVDDEVGDIVDDFSHWFERIKDDAFSGLNGATQDDEVDDFPEPLGEAAFYGLAGDFVRCISPQTEAHPAATLIQFLGASGNVFDSGPHATVGDDRHALNTYVALVGISSKGRKGLSWNHVKRVVGNADESWRKECLSGGLSSGEGLIYSVRDPVVKRVKQKDGSYTDEVVDQGVSDKRHMFVETEMSSSLRMMSREGNTLSSVIRAAFDNGDLRTAVKNSPNHATGAHISINTHVTRDELRRELTATNQANGFANRFLWVAVRRANVLAKGGRLNNEDLNKFVMRLRRAIDFAKTVDEIVRDDDAETLWESVYTELSSEKPGLLGSVLARAEALVLRLSCIYALLDLSNVIRVSHLRAALAVWDYCERSTRWIFGTATGNPDADKILEALRTAGSNGLNRRDIICGVFQRNINAARLDVALGVLTTLGKAKSTMIETKGRKAEKWVTK
jgi:DnaB-like helicase N terminal domain